MPAQFAGEVSIWEQLELLSCGNSRTPLLLWSSELSYLLIPHHLLSFELLWINKTGPCSQSDSPEQTEELLHFLVGPLWGVATFLKKLEFFLCEMGLCLPLGVSEGIRLGSCQKDTGLAFLSAQWILIIAVVITVRLLIARIIFWEMFLED